MERQGEGSPPRTEATAVSPHTHTARSGFTLGQSLLIDQRNSGKFIHHSKSQGKPAPVWRRKCGFWD